MIGSYEALTSRIDDIFDQSRNNPRNHKRELAQISAGQVSLLIRNQIQISQEKVAGWLERRTRYPGDLLGGDTSGRSVNIPLLQLLQTPLSISLDSGQIIETCFFICLLFPNDFTL